MKTTLTVLRLLIFMCHGGILTFILKCNISIIFISAEGHSIYVRNLPFDATVDQLEEEFKKFGPIKRDGIQVRSNKVLSF